MLLVSTLAEVSKAVPRYILNFVLRSPRSMANIGYPVSVVRVAQRRLAARPRYSGACLPRPELTEEVEEASFVAHAELWIIGGDRRSHINQCRPHSGLGYQTPDAVYQSHLRSFHQFSMARFSQWLVQQTGVGHDGRRFRRLSVAVGDVAIRTQFVFAGHLSVASVVVEAPR